MSELIMPGDREMSGGKKMNVCSFVCQKSCSEVCCNGATLITIEEIKDIYDIFPIYIGFRKYFPLDKEHKTFLKNMGGEVDDYYILGDFIAGNRFRKTCFALDEDKLCKLHKIGKKPLQCRIVPFCPVYPEGLQDIIFMEQRKVKFAECEGYKDSSTESIVWKDGSFTDLSIKNAFYDFQRGFEKQSSIMKDILLTIYKEDFFKNFLEGEGILEMPIPIPFLFRVLEESGLSDEESIKFIVAQTKICQKELDDESAQNTVIEDWFTELKKLTRIYQEYLQNKTE